MPVARAGVSNASRAPRKGRTRLRIYIEPGEGGAQMCPGIVPEFDDAGMLVESSLDDAALYAAAAAMDQPDFAEAGGRGRVDVGMHDRWNIAGRERVQIELRLDRDSNRLGSHQPSAPRTAFRNYADVLIWTSPRDTETQRRSTRSACTARLARRVRRYRVFV